MFEALLFVVFVGLLAWLTNAAYRLGYEDGHDQATYERDVADRLRSQAAEDRPAVRDADA